MRFYGAALLQRGLLNTAVRIQPDRLHASMEPRFFSADYMKGFRPVMKRVAGFYGAALLQRGLPVCRTEEATVWIGFYGAALLQRGLL